MTLITQETADMLRADGYEQIPKWIERDIAILAARSAGRSADDRHS